MVALCSKDRFDKIFADHKPKVAKRKVRGSHSKRSRTIGAPRLVRDAMDPIRSQGDGEMYDSKSAYYAHLKRDGLEIADQKPEKPVFEDKTIISTEDVKNAFEQSCAELNK